MNGLGDRIFSIEQATELLIQNKGVGSSRTGDISTSFQDIFKQKLDAAEEVKFSKHANQRLESSYKSER